MLNGVKLKNKSKLTEIGQKNGNSNFFKVNTSEKSPTSCHTLTFHVYRNTSRSLLQLKKTARCSQNIQNKLKVS